MNYHKNREVALLQQGIKLQQEFAYWVTGIRFWIILAFIDGILAFTHTAFKIGLLAILGWIMILILRADKKLEGLILIKTNKLKEILKEHGKGRVHKTA